VERASGRPTAKAAPPFPNGAAFAFCLSALKVGQVPTVFYQKTKRNPKLATLPTFLRPGKCKAGASGAVKEFRGNIQKFAGFAPALHFLPGRLFFEFLFFFEGFSVLFEKMDVLKSIQIKPFIMTAPLIKALFSKYVFKLLEFSV
jgi:hypothetical protein